MSRGSVIIHTPDEIRRIRKAAQLSALAREQIAREAWPGMSTKELDDVAGAIIHSLGGRPAAIPPISAFRSMTKSCTGSHRRTGIC